VSEHIFKFVCLLQLPLKSSIPMHQFNLFYEQALKDRAYLQLQKMLLTHRDQDTSASDISNLLSVGMGLMEVSIIRYVT
jgi:hypothetical protein